MSWDFIPDKPEPKPNTTKGGSSFTEGKNVFIDIYNNHLDAHTLFSTPPIKSEFNNVENYKVAERLFSSDQIKRFIDRGNKWYGDKIDYEKLINGYTQFQNPDLLNSTISKIKNEIKDDMFSGLEKPRMKINDRFGMFSFDLASMAMTYIYDYYNKNGIKVDSNYVKKKKDKFYFEPTNEEVEQRIKKRENGSPYVISSVRNCLIDFEKQEKQERSVEIIVNNSFFDGEEANTLIYNSMASVAVAQNLLLKGFKVKITSLLTVKNGNSKKMYYHFVPVKRFNQPLDANAVAYVCGDPVFFRYQGFKMIIKGYDNNKDVSPSTVGSIINDKKLISNNIESDYVVNSTRKQADTRLYFGGSRNLNQVKNEVNEALEILNQRYGKKNN